MKNSGASFLSVLLSHNDFPNVEISNLSPVEYPEGIFKTVSPDNTACVESGIYHSPFPFNEMLMSANVGSGIKDISRSKLRFFRKTAGAAGFHSADIVTRQGKAAVQRKTKKTFRHRKKAFSRIPTY